jgi:hypothetical protein
MACLRRGNARRACPKPPRLNPYGRGREVRSAIDVFYYSGCIPAAVRINTCEEKREFLLGPVRLFLSNQINEAPPSVTRAKTRCQSVGLVVMCRPQPAPTPRANGNHNTGIAD